MAEEKKSKQESYVVRDGNVKIKGTWYREGASLLLTEEEYTKLSEAMRYYIKPKKGGA